jgi:hypothetical protein
MGRLQWKHSRVCSLYPEGAARGWIRQVDLFELAKGDEQVPNPTITAILRAGELDDVATYYRNDLAFAVDSNVPRLRIPS